MTIFIEVVGRDWRFRVHGDGDAGAKTFNVKLVDSVDLFGVGQVTGSDSDACAGVGESLGFLSVDLDKKVEVGVGGDAAGLTADGNLFGLLRLLPWWPQIDSVEDGGMARAIALATLNMNPAASSEVIGGTTFPAQSLIDDDGLYFVGAQPGVAGG